MDAGADILRAQALLLKVFLMIGGRQSAEYIKALTASIMLWAHYESCQHPCWQIFQHNASAFNEESGEISLSILARDIARGGIRSDCKKVSQTFSLVKAKAEVAQDIGVDLAGDDFGSDIRGRELKVDSPEVAATAAYFAGVIRHISAGSYRHFDKTCGVLAKGATSARVTVPMQAFPASFRRVTPDLEQAVKKLQTSTQTFWVAPHVDIWPGALPSVDFASDLSDVEVADADDAKQSKAQSQQRKRKAQVKAQGKPAAKQKKAAPDTDFVDRVMAVPVWKFGASWAGQNYKRPMTSVLIGDITSVDSKAHPFRPFVCHMREDAGYSIQLTRDEVDRFVLEGAAADNAEDTPCIDGKRN
jgi:hypothetical protein